MASQPRRALSSRPVEIDGPAGVLEARMDSIRGRVPSAVALLCHPHPLQQGTMQNKVVTTLARAFVELGAVALRFNFRGVGGSAGEHSGGPGERGDARAAAAWARARWPRLPLYLGGFSFGAAIALAIADEVAPRGIVTVAIPVERLPHDFVAPRCPWLLVHGAADDVVPPGPVLAWAERLEAPPRVVVLPEVGHFFHGRLRELEQAVTGFFAADFERSAEAAARC